ncbi:MAG TPA: hypothetical protein VKT32_02245 [Chthonomonadaceae bacterium]|nr:hypothetical protein [Chthonomonadaceae bacterium]
MQRILTIVVGAVLAGALLAGCGSGGGSSAGGSGTTTTLAGRVQLPANGALPAGLKAEVLGTSIAAPVAADGSFTLTGVPVGTQTIVIVDPADPNGPPVSAETVDAKQGSGPIPPLPAPTTFTPSSASGLSAVVYEGPISPASISGQPNFQPYPGATLQIQPQGGSAAAVTVTSDASGHVAVSLAPGQYEVVPMPGPGGVPHATPFLITVMAGQTSNIQVMYDTGIR